MYVCANELQRFSTLLTFSRVFSAISFLNKNLIDLQNLVEEGLGFFQIIHFLSSIVQLICNGTKENKHIAIRHRLCSR
jgi:hypothetical protein